MVAGALPSGLAPIGLLLAAAMSVTNVMTDVWRKRALDQRDLFPATFWIRIAVAVLFAVVLLVQILRSVPIVIRDAACCSVCSLWRRCRPSSSTWCSMWG